jgi:hypothetical protein
MGFSIWIERMPMPAIQLLFFSHPLPSAQIRIAEADRLETGGFNLLIDWLRSSIAFP